jgi:hypothetical protein
LKPAFPFLLAVLLAACSPDATPAQATHAAVPADPGVPPATADAGSDHGEYPLTRANVDAFFDAQPLLAAASDADPSLDPAMDLSEEDADQFAARLQATPALRDAIARAGLSTRDYARTSEQLLGALMAQGALDAGLLQELPEGVSRRNVDFVRTHKAQIEARLQSLQR